MIDEKKRKVAYTCVLGNDTDPLREPTAWDPEWNYVCFTDNVKLVQRLQRARVSWHPILTRGVRCPCLSSRQIKILSHRYFPWVTHSLWIDAAYRLDSSPGAAMGLLGDADFLAMRHPHRNRISEEAEAIVRLGLAPEAAVRKQLEDYRSEGWDTEESPQQAISSTGYLLRRHSPKMELFESMWFEQLKKYCYRDQMSVDYVVWKTGVRVNYILGHYRDNPYAKWFLYRPVRCHPNLRPASGVYVV